MMTLGADLAPAGRTAEFLGVWRMIGDTGQAIAPLVVGSIADVIGIALTAGVVAGLGGLAAVTLALVGRETRWDHEPRPIRKRRPRPAVVAAKSGDEHPSSSIADVD
jgi:hypothetical protein